VDWYRQSSRSLGCLEVAGNEDTSKLISERSSKRFRNEDPAEERTQRTLL
jgi:hypothetical protein